MKGNMKLVVIDDDPKACADLTGRLKSFDFFKIVGSAYNGFDGLELIDTSKPDVVFLDVELPDISGLDFIDRSSYLRESGCKVVLYTSFDKYVLPALRRRVHDVLLKPIEDAEMQGVVRRLVEQSHDKPAIKRHDGGEDLRYVLFTNSVDFTIISRKDIGLFQYDSLSRCWEAVVAGISHPVRLRRNVKSDQLLSLDCQYVQVHQKYIINTDYLINVVDSHCHFFPPFEGIDYVTVGRVYRERLLDRFMSF